MKRNTIAWLLCLACLMAGLTACGPKDNDTETPAPPSSGQSTPDVPSGSEPQADDPMPPEVPEDPNAIDFFDCGAFELPNTGQPTGRENFEEFLNVTGVGKSASIQITQYTTEGDPIVSTLTYDGSAYTLKADNTQDAFAAEHARGVRESSWERLVITETTENGVLYQVFRLTNLDEGAITGDTPDGDDVYTLFREPLES